MNSNNLTIIHFVHTLYGGVANVAANLINYQHDIGIKTVLAYCKYDSSIESQIHHEFDKICISMKKFPGESMILGMKILKTYKDYVVQNPNEFVIIHAHNIQALGAYANWKDLPIICTLHGFNSPQKNIRKYFSDYFYKSALSKLIKYNKKITAVSKAIVDAKECKNIKDKSNIHIIHNFAEVNIKDKQTHPFFTIGHVGDLSYEKGWDTLWKAYTLLTPRERKYIHLHAAGKESDFTISWLANETQKLGLKDSIIYEGYVANAKKNFIAKLDVLVLASRNEGLGLVQIEAMGYGIPVLARNTGGICEVLSDNYNGFIIKNEIDLCNRIRQLYNDKNLYARLSKNALKTYNYKFSCKQIIKLYMSVYEELLIDNNATINLRGGKHEI